MSDLDRANRCRIWIRILCISPPDRSLSTLGAQISPPDRSFFAQEYPIQILDFRGGPKNIGIAKSRISADAPPGPLGPVIHVSGSRSEPGNTRLSKDDGSMASKLPQIIFVLFSFLIFFFLIFLLSLFLFFIF